MKAGSRNPSCYVITVQARHNFLYVITTKQSFVLLTTRKREGRQEEEKIIKNF